MTERQAFFYMMQIAGGTFPSGGFSQSWGLETYVSEGRITDSEGFKAFLLVYLDSTISRCEGPIVCEALRLAQEWNIEEILQLEELSCAVKMTRESRESSLRMGKAFFRIMAEILEDEKLEELRKLCKGQMTYPVIYGLVCARLGMEIDLCLQAFVFSTANALLQSAVKLVPLGNTQAQKVLMQIQPEMERCIEICREIPVEAISNFCPGLDIASIRHENLPVRLYMS